MIPNVVPYGSLALKAIRRGEIVRQLIAYTITCDASGMKKSRHYDCGPEFGFVRVYYDWESRTNKPECWEIEWITVEDCPIDLDGLPKEATHLSDEAIRRMHAACEANGPQLQGPITVHGALGAKEE